MAEGKSNVIELTTENDIKYKGDSLECAVCLQPCIHPAQLPCGHIFCFLCIKGIANQSKKCAMCRHEIPRDFIEHPNLLHTETIQETTPNHDGTYQWFYEGRNGWWRYDDRTSEDIEQAFEMKLFEFQILICGELYIIDLNAKVQYPKRDPTRKRNIKRDQKDIPCKGWWQYDERTSKELEASYKAGERICELLIAGFLYIADLEAMLQIRRNDPSRRRRIKRDLASIPKKGIAGLRTEGEVQNQEQESQQPESLNTTNQLPVESNSNSSALTPVTPSNTPQSPGNEGNFSQQDELEATIERIDTLRLDDNWECNNPWRSQRRVRTFDL